MLKNKSYSFCNINKRDRVRIEMNDFTEKRKFKRLGLSLPVKLRCILSNGKEEINNGVTGDISYNGAYVKGINTGNLKLDDKLHMSILIPRDNRDEFPFSRLTGKTRVVRVERDGIAFEFDEDINRLFVAS